MKVRLHPHAVWSSLARTDSHGFLAPCCEIAVTKSLVQDRKKQLKKGNRRLEVLHLFRWFTHTHTHTHTQQSCRIVDIGIAISFLVGARDRAASPRLVPAVGRPLVLAHVLLRDRSHELRQTATSSKCCAMESMHVHMRVCICMYRHREICMHMLDPTGTIGYL